VNYELMEKDDQISKLSLEINTITLRNKEQYDSKYTEEIMEREKQLSKLNAEYQSLKSNVSMIEEEKKYHEDNYKRANNDLFALRSQMQTLDD
jgi:predicted nuclease with TOPRIM domain